MKAHNARRFGRKADHKGGIEGLPLELAIIVIIAALGGGLMITWMNSIEAPETIGSVDSSVDMISMTSDTKTASFSITVTDGDGDAIKGATVVLSGCGISKGTTKNTVFATTDANGVAQFSSVTLTKTTPGVGYISVQVSAGEYGEDNSLKIPVVR